MVPKELPNGWYQVAVAGNGLGFSKIVSGVLKIASQRTKILSQKKQIIFATCLVICYSG